jgi:hypothetical protein
MTGEKLRALAHWLDVHDPSGEDEVQRELREWADQIDTGLNPKWQGALRMFGDRVFIMSLIAHTLLDLGLPGFDAGFPPTGLGGPTILDLEIAGHTYQLTIESVE